MRAKPTLVALMMASSLPTPVFASPAAEQLCLDSRVRHAAAEALGTWSQNFAFAKVIIGSDGRFGDVSPPRVVSEGSDFVVCHANYHLTKPGSAGSPYDVAVDDFNFRVSQSSDGLQVTLLDFPVQTDGSEEQAQALIARFTINGQPYADVLAANRDRIRRRQN